MHKKGQLLSLDFLLAMGLLVLAFGLALKFGETASFEFEEAREKNETNQTGEQAMILLLSNPQITCELKDAAFAPLGVFLNNCLDTAKDINRQALGIPPEFEFLVQAGSQVIATSSTGPPPALSRQVFSTQIQAVVSSGGVFKKDAYACMRQQSCPLLPLQKTIRLQVWK